MEMLMLVPFIAAARTDRWDRVGIDWRILAKIHQSTQVTWHGELNQHVKRRFQNP
jgi:hypothetical protein